MTGFRSKRESAADKLQDGKCKLCVDGCIACDARAQPAQEPVATISITQRGSTRTIDNHFADCVSNWPEGEYKLVLAAPPKREWVGLTEEEAYDLSGVSYNIFAIRAIEKALQEKNT